jgi:hypothetical protein
MAFVVAKRDGRFEIRESRMTDRGPRARSLATFEVLTDDVLDLAVARAHALVDRGAVMRKAGALGAAVVRDPAAATARTLVAQLRRGDRLPAALVAELRRLLPRATANRLDSLEGAGDWVGRSDVERGAALRDLLSLASAIPTRERPGRLAFPPIRSGWAQ